MAIDKAIDYVEQDGSLNFIKNSKSVTVPKEFKARKNAPATKLAYITADEAKMLKKMKKGTPHKGPKGIPSYDSFGSIDASGRDTGRAGSQVSAAERGDFRGFDGSPSVELPPGVKPKGSKEAQDLRSAFIAAGGGQRVNPGFFDSRNTVSPQELALAKQFNPTAFRKSRGSGIMNFIRSGGLLGNLIRGIGQRLGLGKRFNEPTYDMRQFSDLGLLTDRVNPSYYNDLDNEDLLSLVGTGGITNTVPFDADTFDDDVNLTGGGYRGIPGINVIKDFPTVKFGGTVLEDELIPATKPDDNRVLPKNLDLGLPNDYYAKVSQDDINKSKTRTFKAMDYDTYKLLNKDSQITPFEFEELKKGNITEPGTYTT
mgnify:CR=1 FL=1